MSQRSGSCRTGTCPKSDAVYAHLRSFVLSSETDRAMETERRLAKLHGVTVGTVRRALKRLTEEGLICTIHGKGSFVAARQPRKETPRIVFIDDWKNAEHSFYASRIRGMSMRASACGYRLEIFSCMNRMRDGELERLVEELRAPEVIGVIVPWLDDTRFRTIREANPEMCIVSTTNTLQEPGTISVLPDYTAMGRLAAGYLVRGGAKRISTLGFISEAHQGAEREMRLAEGGEAEALPQKFASCAVMAADWLLSRKPEGVAFFDDRLAQSVLAELQRRAPDYWRERPVISASNTGEDILPGQMARLENDGARLGTLAIQAIRTMREGIDLGGTRILVSPRFLAP